MSQRKSRPDRQSAGRADLEEAILKAAEAEFAEKGFEGSTTSAIAARAGLPKANLHYYVATKEALYRRVVEGVLAAWLDAARSFDESASAEAALTRYIEGKMDLARERPLGSRIFAREVMRGAPVIQDFLDTTLTDWVRERGAAVERWIAEGQIRPLDPKVLFFMIWATTQHYADFAHQIAALNGGEPLGDEGFAAAKRQVVETLLRGIAAPRPDDRRRDPA
jgi:TetR/AcrR family transcriptional regulator